MTKEELDKEAEVFTDSKKSFWRQGRTCIDSVKQAYIAGAEPREKQVAELEKENAELKEKVSFLEDNLRVARKDREKLQLDVAKGLKEFVKDYPATSLRYLANEKYIEQLTKAKEIIKKFLLWENDWHNKTESKYELLKQAEQFLKESEE